MHWSKATMHLLVLVMELLRVSGRHTLPSQDKVRHICVIPIRHLFIEWPIAWCGWLVVASAYPLPCLVLTAQLNRNLRRPNGKSSMPWTRLRKNLSDVGFSQSTHLELVVYLKHTHSVLVCLSSYKGVLVFLPWPHDGACRGQGLGTCITMCI